MDSCFHRLAAIVLTVASTLLAIPISAQPAGSVDCGNGNYCPRGNVCLVGGLCARAADKPAGAVASSTGDWCDPGFREHKFRPGACIPDSYSECRNGLACAPGMRCNTSGGCDGGPPATGPTCGGVRCMAGRICSSRNTCLNTEYYQDCGNGSICTKAAACEQPKGCVYVEPGRTRQIPLTQ